MSDAQYKPRLLFIWSLAQHWSARIISLLTFLLLARLLKPADFGIVAIATVFVGLSEIISDQGFGDAVVRHPNLTKAAINSAFFANVLTSTALAGILAIAAPAIAAGFEVPVLCSVIQVLSATFVLSGLSSVQAALLRREGQYRSLTVRTIVANLLSAVVSIAAAFSGLGVWALVLQQLTYSLVSSVTLWILGGFRPSVEIDFPELKTILGFSVKTILARVSDYFHIKSVDSLIGIYLGPVAVGIYSVGTRLGLIIIQLLGAALSDAALTHFSKERERRKEAYAFLIVGAERVAFISGSVFLFLAVNASDVIQLVFGEKWVASAPVFSAFCAAGSIQALAYLCAPVIAAAGRAGFLLGLSLAKLAFIVCSFYFVIQVGLSLNTLAWVVNFVAVLVFVPITLLKATNILGVSPRELILRVGLVYAVMLVGVLAMSFARMVSSDPLVRMFGSGTSYVVTLTALIGMASLLFNTGLPGEARSLLRAARRRFHS